MSSNDDKYEGMDWLRAELEESIDEDYELEISEPALSMELRKIYKRKHPDTLDRQVYFKALLSLQSELIKLQDWVQHTGEKIVVLGTVPTREGLRTLLASPLAAARISPLVKASENMLSVARAGEGVSGLTVAEIAGKPGECTLESDMTDLLSGQTFKAGRVEVAPYDVMVLRADSVKKFNENNETGNG